MTYIGEASLNIVPNAQLEVLEKILATLERIEEQGKPKEANVFVINTAEGLNEDTIAQAAQRAVYWDLLRSNNGTPEPKAVAEEFLKKVEASTGEPVTLGDKQCVGCDECCDD